ncbi:heterokaryon incompatibility protein-domain-containing protein [Microdochium bolleyi]|uniref:Heterokaryon incompatibility protein-domain-containing protein n=1 Tax=Microdochium bolleyi TaxID=196109 RepID=A0A136ILU0_9PEZI|nr:heterokaryon incompatibility protein-domain-containing protein [Microdochium bolleyi]
MSVTPTAGALLDDQSIYKAIIEYQTRLVALRGDRGDPNTPLECSLHVVDMLRADFGHGLGLRDLPDKTHPRLIEYDALLYAWGTGQPDRLLRCQGVDMSIMANLYEALLALRRAGETTRWLWVDGVCINQKDSLDKAMQIPNMMFIYQQASCVVAWLDELVDPDVLFHAAAAGSSLAQKLGEAPSAALLASDLDTVAKALLDIYNKPYFQRVWVQQEIFTNRNLVFRSRHSDLELT